MAFEDGAFPAGCENVLLLGRFRGVKLTDEEGTAEAVQFQMNLEVVDLYPAGHGVQGPNSYKRDICTEFGTKAVFHGDSGLAVGFDPAVWGKQELKYPLRASQVLVTFVT